MFWWETGSEAAVSGFEQEQHQDCINSNRSGDSSSMVVSYSDS